jgi:Leucine-rich repeat (LRR) protein
MWYWCEVKKNPRNRSRIQNLRRDVTNVTILARKLNLHQIQILISISLVVVARSIKEVFFPTNVLLPPFLNFRHRIGLVAWFLPTPPEHPSSSSVLLSGSCCFIFRFLCSALWLLFTPPSNYLSFCLPLLLITPPISNIQTTNNFAKELLNSFQINRICSLFGKFKITVLGRYYIKLRLYVYCIWV